MHHMRFLSLRNCSALSVKCKLKSGSIISKSPWISVPESPTYIEMYRYMSAPWQKTYCSILKNLKRAHQIHKVSSPDQIIERIWNLYATKNLVIRVSVESEMQTCRLHKQAENCDHGEKHILTHVCF